MNIPERSGPPERVGSAVTVSKRGYTVSRPSPTPLSDNRVVYDDEAPVFVLANLRVALGFPLRSVRRHFRVASMIFGGLFAIFLVGIALAPRHYMVETKFLAEKNFVMPSLGNPRRAVPTESDAPTRLAQEAVMKRTNLMEIVRQTKMISDWGRLRSPLGKLKELVTDRLNGPMTEAERLDAAVDMLAQRMWVYSSDGTVTIGADLPDPNVAFRIVQAAQQNFFEQRRATEVSLIGESIGILEGHVATSQRAIQEALAQINATLPRRNAVTLPSVSRGPDVPQGPSPAVVQLQTELRAAQQAVQDLTTSRLQRMTALQTQLADLRSRYGAAHPEITALEENIAAFNQPSPQLATLEQKEADLRARLNALGARESVRSTSGAAQSVDLALARLTAFRADSQEAPEVTFAKSRLKIATSDYEDMLDRLESAKIEMETARAAFKYRYTLIAPAKLPKSPFKPKVPVLMVGAIVLALAIALFTAILLDFGGGRVLEAWQVDRQLGVPVLAQVRRR